MSTHSSDTTHKAADQDSPATSGSSGRGRSSSTNFLWGAASAVAVIVAAPLLRPFARSVVKTAIKAGRHAQQTGSALKEELEDIYAEAQAEMEEESALKTAEDPEKE